MRKAVAVPYVIALILGVAVIALLGIWFVSAGGKFSGASAETACRGKAVEFCTRFPTGGDAEWNAVKGTLSCDLKNMGIPNEQNTRPDCTQILK